VQELVTISTLNGVLYGMLLFALVAAQGAGKAK
jgi:hypothetical protein